MPRPCLSEEQKKHNRKETLRKYYSKQAAIGNNKNLNITDSIYTRFEELRSKETQGNKKTQAQFLNKLLNVYEAYLLEVDRETDLNSISLNEVRYSQYNYHIY
jgi:hypothetical protein